MLPRAVRLDGDRLQAVAAFERHDAAGDAWNVGRTLDRGCVDDGDLTGQPYDVLCLEARPAVGACDDNRKAGVKWPVAMSAVGDAAALVVSLVGQAKFALVETGGDHDRARRVLFTLGGLDGPRAIVGEAGDVAKTDLDARDSSVIGHSRGHVRAVPDLLEVVQLAEIDQGAARRELVEAEDLETGTGGLGGGSEAGGPGADDDEVVEEYPLAL